MKIKDIKISFARLSKWTTLGSFIIIFYIIAIYAFYLSFKFFYHFIYTILFLRWAKRQKLVLISGGPGSGKKILLNFLNESLKNKNVDTHNHLGFFNSNKSYNIKSKQWEDFYVAVDLNKEKASYYFIDEIEDNSFNLTSKKGLAEKQKNVLKISNSNYFNDRFWIAFSARDGFLWNKLSSRVGSTIECHSVEKVSLKYFKVYLLKISISENQKDSKLKKYTIIFTERVFSEYRNDWLKEFLNENPNLKNL